MARCSQGCSRGLGETLIPVESGWVGIRIWQVPLVLLHIPPVWSHLGCVCPTQSLWGGHEDVWLIWPSSSDLWFCGKLAGRKSVTTVDKQLCCSCYILSLAASYGSHAGTPPCHMNSEAKSVHDAVSTSVKWKSVLLTGFSMSFDKV